MLLASLIVEKVLKLTAQTMYLQKTEITLLQKQKHWHYMTAHAELSEVQPTFPESLEEMQAKNSANALDVQHATPNANTIP